MDVPDMQRPRPGVVSDLPLRGAAAGIMIDEKLTPDELGYLKTFGIEYPWHPRQSLRLLDRIRERLHRRIDEERQRELMTSAEHAVEVRGRRLGLEEALGLLEGE